jgi:hypothetical protein
VTSYTDKWCTNRKQFPGHSTAIHNATHSARYVPHIGPNVESLCTDHQFVQNFLREMNKMFKKRLGHSYLSIWLLPQYSSRTDEMIEIKHSTALVLQHQLLPVLLHLYQFNTTIHYNTNKNNSQNSLSYTDFCTI